MAEVAKALGDPIRLQLVDVLRKHAGKVCVCELVPLFDVSQPTLSHHLKKLREAGIVDSERRGPLGLLLRRSRRTEGAVRMAELDRRDCCDPPRPQASLLRARGKAECCGHGDGCGCAPADAPSARRPRDVRERYAAARAQRAPSGCVAAAALTDAHGARSSAPRSTPTTATRRAAASAPRSAAASRPPSPICTRARPCSTSAPAPAPTC